MSSLIYRLVDDQVCVAADTLLSASDGQPLKYVTKILPLPNLRGVLCATGSFDLLLDWFVMVQKEMIVPDLPWLAQHAPARLREIARSRGLTPDTKSTIYHFGWDHRMGKMIGHSFASNNDFNLRDAHRGSLVVKPGYPSALEGAGDEVMSNGLDGFVHIMTRQRAEDELQGSEHVGIGGEVHFVNITPEGIGQFMVHRFTDYPQLYAEMLKGAKHF